MKSVTCPYCQTKLTGEFHPGDMIECDSCKGKFQPPPDMLRAVSPVEATCPFCKTVFIVDSPSHFIQCPLCNGKFTIGLATQNSTALRPESVKWATILLASSILIGSILYAILFAIGRQTGSLQLLNTSVQRSLATLPWKLLTVMIAWKLFKGRNWARILFNFFIPIGMLFALMQALDRHFINLANRMSANHPSEVVFWFNFVIFSVLGIVALHCLNSAKSRNWFRLPKERKTYSDQPWWVFVLLLVVLCPIVLFSTAINLADINTSNTHTYTVQDQRAVAEKKEGPLSSSNTGTEREKDASHSDPEERRIENRSTSVQTQGRQQDKTSSEVGSTQGSYATTGSTSAQQTTKQRQVESSANGSSAYNAAASANSTKTESARSSNEPSSPGDRVVLTVRGVEVAFRYCPSTRSEKWKMISGETKKWTTRLGSPNSEAGRFPDEEEYRCELSDFWIMETEVTQGFWKSVMGKNPSTYKSGDNYPVESVSWNDCQDFLNELNDKAPIKGFMWRLPTEAQWEFACRAGTETALPNGKEIVILDKNNAPALDNIAWYGGNSSVEYHGVKGYDTSKWVGKQYPGGMAGPHPVASKKPNRWGLYDMIGNVNEWCSDRYGEKRDTYGYRSGEKRDTYGIRVDPSGPSSGDKRVYHGGGWAGSAKYCRSAWRGSYEPDKKYSDVGLRLVLVSIR